MAEAIVIRQYGGPEVLRLETIEVDAPAAGQMRIRQTAIGVNFHDTYVRTGLYRTLSLPGIPGIEAVGVVEAVGPDVEGFAVGDKIGYVTPQYGGYASERLLPARFAIRLPQALDDALAASLLVKGLTARLLVNRVAPLAPGMVVLVHAAAGGVGRLLSRLASNRGATVIGTVGSEAKGQIAAAAGCAHTILYRQQDFVAEVRRITQGHGVDVVYDSVGKDTFDGSLEVLAKLGHLVNFGQSSGAIPPFEVSRLAAKSNTLSRPILFHYLDDRARLQPEADALFEALREGQLAAEAGQTFALAAAAAAHEALESRAATGPLVLIPGHMS
jgi:NADPH2:quinone reductase